MLVTDAVPNNAHKALAKLEAEGKLSAVITQNVDGLHQKAGSEKVFELHGSIHRNYCTKCGKFFGLDYILDTGTHSENQACIGTAADYIPRCDSCGGTIKPDVVLYEEGLDEQVLLGAINHIRKADVLIIGGTSLAVYPAAGLVDYFKGDKLIVINKTPTSRDKYADLVIQDPIGSVFAKIV